MPILRYAPRASAIQSPGLLNLVRFSDRPKDAAKLAFEPAHA